MFRAVWIGCLLLLAAGPASGAIIEEHILVLSVTNTTEEPVNNIIMTCKGDCSQTSAIQGKVRIKLPPQTRPGEWVTLQFINRTGATD